MNAPQAISALAGYTGADATAFVGRAGIVSAGEFAAAVQRLMRILPAGVSVLNLCVDRFHFLTGLVAALQNECLSLFPDRVNPWVLERLQQRYGECVILGDAPADGSLGKAAHLDLGRLLAGQPLRSPAQIDGLFAPVPVAREVAVVFTSGSTGEPRPYLKTWADLTSIGVNIGQMLGGRTSRLVVSTVPTQHMYGLESTVMTPLRNGMPLHRERPFYPQDIARCLADGPGFDDRPLLITSPLHLRACLRARLALRAAPAQVLTATAPLSPELAADCQHRWGSRILEIFGCTEVGSIAYREPTQDPVWQAFADIELQSLGASEGALVTTRSIGRFEFNDHVEVIDVRHFRLQGRKEDVINLAGKRASLSALNHLLRELDGVEDACLYQPPGDDDARLVAFVVTRAGLTPDDIRAALRDRVDAAFVPRRVFLVPALPHNATGKLPVGALRSLYERLSGRGFETELRIGSDHPSLAGHFPGHPVVPGVVLPMNCRRCGSARAGPVRRDRIGEVSAPGADRHAGARALRNAGEVGGRAGGRIGQGQRDRAGCRRPDAVQRCLSNFILRTLVALVWTPPGLQEAFVDWRLVFASSRISGC
ncbi:MAG: AMP-binding protein [Burkholderiaceae bacterium]